MGPLVFFLAQPFNRKARQGWQGRKKLLSDVSKWREKHPGPLTVIHCASAGEFEAALPLIKAFQEKGLLAAATFFSPSGYKIALKNSAPNLISYLPFDTNHAVKGFLESLRPDLFVFCKHDVWPNIVWACRRRNIPTALVNGNMHERSVRLHPLLRSFFRDVYRSMTAIFAVSESHARRFELILGSESRVEAPGDTRFDRVVERTLKKRVELPRGFADNPVFICGSVWPEEDFTLQVFLEICKSHSDWRLIWVPHEPAQGFLCRVEKALEHAGISHIRFSQIKPESEARALLVDKVGALAALYRYTDIAYVGGGFGRGVHSVIEPAVFSIPVIFGPHYHVSAEAGELVERGGGFTVKGLDQFKPLLQRFIEDEPYRKTCGKVAGELVKEKAGVADYLAHKTIELMNLGSNRLGQG